MRGVPIAGLFAASLALADPASAQTIAPTLVAVPNAQEVATRFPAKARRAGISGRVVLECRVTRLGRLADCLPVEVSTEGLGFEDAAIALSDYFLLTPAMLDGKATDGGVIRLPIVFDIDGDGDPSDTVLPDAPQLCPDGRGCQVLD